MNLKSLDLAWMVVNDIKQAIKFYTETVGLKLMEFDEQYGWAELAGNDGGARIGLAQKQETNGCDGVEPGQNAVVTFSVRSLDKAIDHLTQKGAQLIGKVQEVPGHVKLQTVCDTDGNRFQLAEVLHHSCPHC